MQAAATAQSIQTDKTPLILRNDTMLGVCTGLGREFGFNPNYLRVLIASLFLVDFKIAIGIYFALGLALAIGSLLFPSRRRPTTVAVGEQTAIEANDSAPVPETLAA
ncbi:MAG: PspC domain-containing protein [Sphingomonas sp.]|nr:PspC domain-containing protein [Sphingomonas sp.]